MLGCAIAERICGRQNVLLRGKSLVGRLRLGYKNDSSGLFSVSSESPVTKCRHYYGAIIRGRRGIELCALKQRPSISACNSRAVQIQTRGYSQTTRPYDIDTNLTKDVILYKYDNPKYFKRLNIFGFVQLMFWTYLARFVFTELKDAPVSETETEDVPWWRRINFGESTHRKVLTFLTFLVGYSMFSLAWLHTLKSVRYIVLRKGGKDITLVTYTPFGENRLRTVPLEKVTAKQSRQAATAHIPIKVKGDWTHYLVDMRGEFRHNELFDFTAGLQRPI